MDRRRRAADRRSLDGVGAGAALDWRNTRRSVWVCGTGQRLGAARPPFRMGGAKCGGRAGRGGILERFQAKWRPVRVKKTRQIKNLEPRFDSIETEKGSSARPHETAVNASRERATVYRLPDGTVTDAPTYPH